MVKKILLVEDEDLIIKILEKKLSEKGYEVLLSRNGKEGLEARPCFDGHCYAQTEWLGNNGGHE